MQVSTVQHAFPYMLASCCPGSDAGASALAARAWLWPRVACVEWEPHQHRVRGQPHVLLVPATEPSPGCTPGRSHVATVCGGGFQTRDVRTQAPVQLSVTVGGVACANVTVVDDATLHVTVPLAEVGVGRLEVVVTVRPALASYTGRGLLDRGLTAATPQAQRVFRSDAITDDGVAPYLVTELDEAPPVQSPRLTRVMNGLRAAFEFDANLGPAGLAGVAGVLGVVPSDVVTWFERARAGMLEPLDFQPFTEPTHQATLNGVPLVTVPVEDSQVAHVQADHESAADKPSAGEPTTATPCALADTDADAARETGGGAPDDSAGCAAADPPAVSAPGVPAAAQGAATGRDVCEDEDQTRVTDPTAMAAPAGDSSAPRTTDSVSVPGAEASDGDASAASSKDGGASSKLPSDQCTASDPPRRASRRAVFADTDSSGDEAGAAEVAAVVLPTAPPCSTDCPSGAASHPAIVAVNDVVMESDADSDTGEQRQRLRPAQPASSAHANGGGDGSGQQVYQTRRRSSRLQRATAEREERAAAEAALDDDDGGPGSRRCVWDLNLGRGVLPSCSLPHHEGGTTMQDLSAIADALSAGDMCGAPRFVSDVVRVWCGAVCGVVWCVSLCVVWCGVCACVCLCVPVCACVTMALYCGSTVSPCVVCGRDRTVPAPAAQRQLCAGRSTSTCRWNHRAGRGSPM